jgi:hypothetical protein
MKDMHMRYTMMFILCLCVLSLGSISLAQTPEQATPPAIQQDGPNINFEWAFGALIGKDKQFVGITHDTVLNSSEEMKMMVKLDKDCYVYLLHYDSQGEVDLLFPYSLSQMQTDYSLDKNYYVPKGRNWIVLDKNPGKEIFFLVASSTRLLDLEAKIGEYLGVTDAAKKKPLAENIVSEVRGLRKNYASFATLTEKPLTIGGNVRALEEKKETHRPDVADFSISITAKNFYSKTFTIDHQ